MDALVFIGCSLPVSCSPNGSIIYRVVLVYLNLTPSSNRVAIILSGQSLSLCFYRITAPCCRQLGVGSNLPSSRFFPQVIAALSTFWSLQALYNLTFLHVLSQLSFLQYSGSATLHNKNRSFCNGTVYIIMWHERVCCIHWMGFILSFQSIMFRFLFVIILSYNITFWYSLPSNSILVINFSLGTEFHTYVMPLCKS